MMKSVVSLSSKTLVLLKYVEVNSRSAGPSQPVAWSQKILRTLTFVLASSSISHMPIFLLVLISFIHPFSSFLDENYLSVFLYYIIIVILLI